MVDATRPEVTSEPTLAQRMVLEVVARRMRKRGELTAAPSLDEHYRTVYTMVREREDRERSSD